MPKSGVGPPPREELTSLGFNKSVTIIAGGAVGSGYSAILTPPTDILIVGVAMTFRADALKLETLRGLIYDMEITLAGAPDYPNDKIFQIVGDSYVNKEAGAAASAVQDYYLSHDLQVFFPYPRGKKVSKNAAINLGLWCTNQTTVDLAVAGYGVLWYREL